MAKIKFYTKHCRTFAAIRPNDHSAWFSVPVAQARKAIKVGCIDYGVVRGLPVEAA